MTRASAHWSLNSCSGEPAARGSAAITAVMHCRRCCLNSCSGEPAARGDAAPAHGGEARGVSIPVLVNLRLGVSALFNFVAKAGPYMSQFLFW